MWERVELTVLLGAPSETFSDGLETQRERESVCVCVCIYEIEEASSSGREREREREREVWLWVWWRRSRRKTLKWKKLESFLSLSLIFLFLFPFSNCSMKTFSLTFSICSKLKQCLIIDRLKRWTCFSWIEIPCNSINLDRLFNLTLINLTPHIRHPSDLCDSLLPFPSLFFCLQLVQVSERNKFSLLLSYP